MNKNRPTPEPETAAQLLAVEGLGTSNCSTFDLWWTENGIKCAQPIMELAFKEVALRGWIAAAEKSAAIAESWGFEAKSVIRMKLLPKSP